MSISLIQLAKTQRERSYQNKLWLLHWHSRIRYLGATSPTASPDVNHSSDTSYEELRQRQAAAEETERCKSLMATKRDEIPRQEAKQAYAEAELKVVLPRYRDLLHPTVCSGLYEKLPRELRNMIYSYFDNFTDEIQAEHSTHGIGGVPTSPFFDGDCSAHAWDNPWYFDPSCVGPDLAREMVELQYGKSRFCLNDDALIPRLLDEDRWQTGTIPRIHIRQIELDILDEQEFKDEVAQKRLKDTIGFLRRLESEAKVSINLFNLSPSSYDVSHICESRSDGQCIVDTTTQNAASSTAYAISIYAKLVPVIEELQQHGHTMSFADRSLRDAGKLTLNSWWPSQLETSS